jgi:hypothetical protein
VGASAGRMDLLDALPRVTPAQSLLKKCQDILVHYGPRGELLRQAKLANRGLTFKAFLRKSRAEADQLSLREFRRAI